MGQGPTPPAEEDVPEVKGLPVLPSLQALAEIVILFALIYGIDRLTPSLAILDLSPHPFWIPVLLVSLQYGTVSGFLAAAVAIVLSLFAGLPEQDIGENLFAYFLRVFGQPILWIAVALLVGQFRMRQLGAKQELRHANHALKVQRDDLARHAHALRGRVERLEQELATRYSTPPHAGAAVLAQTMAEGGLFDEATRQAVLQRTATALFPEAVVTVYRVRDGILTECAVCGRKPDTGPRILIPGEDPLYQTIVTQGRRVSVLDPMGEKILGTTGLAAVPIPGMSPSGVTETAAVASLTPVTPDAFGMVVIERAGPAAITPNGLMALELMAHALQPRMTRRIGAKPRTRIITPRRVRPSPTSLLVLARSVVPGASDGARPAVDRRNSLIARISSASASNLPATPDASLLISKPNATDTKSALTATEVATGSTESVPSE